MVNKLFGMIIIMIVCAGILITVSLWRYELNKKNEQIEMFKSLIKESPDTLNNRQCSVLFRYCLKSGIDTYQCGKDLKQCLKPVNN